MPQVGEQNTTESSISAQFSADSLGSDSFQREKRGRKDLTPWWRRGPCPPLFLINPNMENPSENQKKVKNIRSAENFFSAQK